MDAVVGADLVGAADGLVVEAGDAERGLQLGVEAVQGFQLRGQRRAVRLVERLVGGRAQQPELLVAGVPQPPDLASNQLARRLRQPQGLVGLPLEQRGAGVLEHADALGVAADYGHFEAGGTQKVERAVLESCLQQRFGCFGLPSHGLRQCSRTSTHPASQRCPLRRMTCIHSGLLADSSVKLQRNRRSNRLKEERVQALRPRP